MLAPWLTSWRGFGSVLPHVEVVGLHLPPSVGRVPGPQSEDCGSVLSSIPWVVYPELPQAWVGTLEVLCSVLLPSSVCNGSQVGVLGFVVLCNLLGCGLWTLVYPKGGLGGGGFCFLLPSSVGGGSWLLWVVGSVPLRVGSGTWVLSSVYFYCQRELWTLVWILGSVWFYLPTWVVTLA
jgi:hypothetical protein